MHSYWFWQVINMKLQALWTYYVVGVFMSGQKRRRMKESICVSPCIKSRSDLAIEAVKLHPTTAPSQPKSNSLRSIYCRHDTKLDRFLYNCRSWGKHKELSTILELLFNLQSIGLLKLATSLWLLLFQTLLNCFYVVTGWQSHLALTHWCWKFMPGVKICP